MSLPESERNAIIHRYTERFGRHAYSPKTLGWEKGKQDLRFDILTSQYDFRNKRILDIGCGFGDLNRTLQPRYGNQYQYVGVDLVPVLVEEARAKHGTSKINFFCADILADDFGGDFDYAIASGVFNHKMESADNYAFIEAVMRKALSHCRDGIAFDFLSDKVDFRHEHTFHSSPERILGLAYQSSRNVVLRNDYMPFEFSLFIHRDDSFLSEDTVFCHYKKRLLTGSGESPDSSADPVP